MESHLTIKHLAAYLPYGLKFRSSYAIDVSTYTLSSNQLSHWESGHIKPFLPILRPLSDLTKEIGVNGEKFIPIVKLADKAGFLHGKDYKIVDYGFGFSDYVSWDFFRYDYENKNFYFDIGNNYDGSKDSRVENSFELVNILLEWHFDIYSLIPNNLAIDINTLK